MSEACKFVIFDNMVLFLVLSNDSTYNALGFLKAEIVVLVNESVPMNGRVINQVCGLYTNSYMLIPIIIPNITPNAPSIEAREFFVIALSIIVKDA